MPEYWDDDIVEKYEEGLNPEELDAYRSLIALRRKTTKMPDEWNTALEQLKTNFPNAFIAYEKYSDEAWESY